MTASEEWMRRYLAFHTEEGGPAPTGTPHYHAAIDRDGVTWSGYTTIAAYIDEAYENSRRQVDDLQNCGTLLHEWVEEFIDTSSRQDAELWDSPRWFDFSHSSQPDTKLWENLAHNPLDDIYATLRSIYGSYPSGIGRPQYVLHARPNGKMLLYRRMKEARRVLRSQALQRLQDTVPKRNYFRNFVAQHWTVIDPRMTRGASQLRSRVDRARND